MGKLFKVCINTTNTRPSKTTQTFYTTCKGLKCKRLLSSLVYIVKVLKAHNTVS